MPDCYSCELMARRDADNAPLWDCILRASHWDLVHAYNTSLPGWLALVARRHIEAIADLSEDEAVELGSLLRRVSLALREVTGCAKTYVVQFADHPKHPHVHVHIIPRMPDEPEAYRGPGVFNLSGVPGEERVSEARMNEIATRIRRLLEP